MAQQPLVILEDAVLVAMAGNPALVKELPFLKSLRRDQALPARRGCGTCNEGPAAKASHASFESAKKLIASLDSGKKRAIKSLMNTRGLRVVYRDNSNRLIELTF